MIAAVLGFAGAIAVSLAPAGFAALLGAHGSSLCFPPVSCARESMILGAKQLFEPKSYGMHNNDDDSKRNDAHTPDNMMMMMMMMMMMISP